MGMILSAFESFTLVATEGKKGCVRWCPAESVGAGYPSVLFGGPRPKEKSSRRRLGIIFFFFVLEKKDRGGRNTRCIGSWWGMISHLLLSLIKETRDIGHLVMIMVMVMLMMVLPGTSRSRNRGGSFWMQKEEGTKGWSFIIESIVCLGQVGPSYFLLIPTYPFFP